MNLEWAVNHLKNRIKAVNIHSLRIDEFYKRRYLQPKISGIDYWLSKYSKHISWTLLRNQTSSISLNEMLLVDHGGGTGLLGLLAKETGIGTVVYNDIDSKFLEVARELGRAIGVSHDNYVLGDVDQLMAFLKNNSKCTSLVSADVLEHIYDIDRFLSNLPSLSSGSVNVVMSSGANYLNPLGIAKIVPDQMRAERKWRIIRENIICEIAPEIQRDSIDILVKCTKGLLKDEIITLATSYVKTGKIEKKKKRIGNFDPFRTNTCDPLTGWWAEHFLNPLMVARTLNEAGFNSKVLIGNYNTCQESAIARFTSHIVNTLIKRMGVMALPIAPYYVVVAWRKI